ncbi:unnamed protein product, partial [Brenthis ino]
MLSQKHFNDANFTDDSKKKLLRTAVPSPALEKDHLNPNIKQKIKVKLAAQVLSHTVSGGMYAKIFAGELTANATVTANLIFMCCPHLKCFEEMKKFFSTMKYRYKSLLENT